MSGVFSFNQAANETDEQTILRACEKIISTGIAIRGGNVSAGTNNVWADSAARVFSDQILEKVILEQKTDRIVKNGALLMLMRQAYASLTQEQDEEYGKHYLESIARLATEMRMTGWKTEAAPNNLDLNAAGVKLASYKEPVGVAADLAFAFNIGYKKPKPTQKLEKI